MELGIIGGGHASIALVRALREGGYRSSITILEQSGFSPYERPALSKQALEEWLEPKEFGLTSLGEFEGLKVEYRSNSKVKKIYRAGGLFVVVQDNGKSESYGSLVLASGVKPRRLQLHVNPLTPVCYLQNLEDLLGLRSHLKSRKNILIVGAGFIGLEAASSLRRQGHEITVVERGGQVMNRVLGPETANFFQTKLEQMGVRVLLEDSIEDITFHQASSDSTFLLTSATEFSADLVLVSIGVQPITEFIHVDVEMSGEHVLVDTEGNTSVPGLYAIGDIAARPNPQNQQELVKIQSIDAANWAAERLAKHLLGAELDDYSLWLPRFWSEQAGQKLQIAGLRPNDAYVAIRGDLASDSFSIGYFIDSRLVAAECVNAPVDFLNARKLIQTRVKIDPVSFSDTSTNLKTLLQV